MPICAFRKTSTTSGSMISTPTPLFLFQRSTDVTLCLFWGAVLQSIIFENWFRGSRDISCDLRRYHRHALNDHRTSKVRNTCIRAHASISSLTTSCEQDKALRKSPKTKRATHQCTYVFCNKSLCQRYLQRAPLTHWKPLYIFGVGLGFLCPLCATNSHSA